ncbi:MAG: MFS transporter [Roseiarcus sp.]
MKTLSSLAALLLSVFLLIAGNSLIGVLAPLRASLDGFPDLTIGLLGSVYFAGMLAGTLATPAILRRAGHIRAFSAFVALGIVAVILMPGWVAPAPWMVCRGALGFVFAGIYAVVESWINAKASNANRGALYGVYQIVNFAASAGGQLLLAAFAPASFLPFTISGALLALAIVPLAMTSVDPPAHPKSVRLRLRWLVRLAPVSAFAALAAGAANGACFALGPVYALGIGMKPSAVPLFTAAIVAGSALGVYPAGLLSDRCDRRLIIVVAMTAGAAAEALLASLRLAGAPLIFLGFLVGLTTYTLYTLATSHAADRAKPQEMVLVSAGILFIYCIGAIAAPALASLLMRAFGPSALFAQGALVHVAIAAFALWRLATDAGDRPRAASRDPIP